MSLVITGHFCVDKMQRADAGQPVLDETTDKVLLRRACDGVHRYGGKLFFQLSHSGIKGLESMNGAPPKHPEDFSLEELDRLVAQFAFAAKKCEDCGADGVQIHNAHGYLLSNFLNPEENLRTDEYGGSLANRFRLIERILRAVRAACGTEFPMIVKADSNGCGDLSALLRLYERCGVDGAEVSGIDFNRRAGQKTPFYLDALICEPDFAAKLKSGAQDESKCLACNGCYTIYRKRFVRCVQHQDEIEQFKTIPW